MQYEELIKKLENTDLPEIEISGHKARLRRVLMNSDYYKKPGVLNVLRKPFVFAAPALIIASFLGFVAIQPKLAEATAMNIARNDANVQKLLAENNMTPQDIKIKDGMAYILLNLEGNGVSGEVNQDSGGDKSIRVSFQNSKGKESDNFSGAVVEINLHQKKVYRIQKMSGDEIAPLADKEKEDAKEIVKQERTIREIIPAEAAIEKVESAVSGNLHLTEKDEKIEVVSGGPEQRKAKIHYSDRGKRWTVKVDLEKKEVEGVVVSADGDND